MKRKRSLARRTFVVNKVSMRKRSIASRCFAILGLGILAVMAGCSRPPDDVQIVKSVQTEIQKDPSISGDVKVESEHGMVTLRGHVASEAERAAAARDAAGITGVAGVYNLLAMEPA